VNETMVCVVGNVATRPVYRDGGQDTGPAFVASARFRLAATARYWDRQKNMWVDGHSNFFTVWAGRSLATNVAASLSVGDPVVVHGRLKVRSEVHEGQTWTSADIDAVAVGHDLSRGTSAFRRGNRPDTAAQEAGAAVGQARNEPVWETPPGGEVVMGSQPPPFAPLLT
jgi:single-strand DNA-binding protein